MPKKYDNRAKVRDWSVLVRFRSSGKQVIMEAMEHWVPPPGEKKTISSFIRQIVWDYCRPPEAPKNGG